MPAPHTTTAADAIAADRIRGIPHSKLTAHAPRDRALLRRRGRLVRLTLDACSNVRDVGGDRCHATARSHNALVQLLSRFARRSGTPLRQDVMLSRSTCCGVRHAQRHAHKSMMWLRQIAQLSTWMSAAGRARVVGAREAVRARARGRARRTRPGCEQPAGERRRLVRVNAGSHPTPRGTRRTTSSLRSAWRAPRLHLDPLRLTWCCAASRSRKTRGLTSPGRDAREARATATTTRRR